MYINQLQDIMLKPCPTNASGPVEKPSYKSFCHQQDFDRVREVGASHFRVKLLSRAFVLRTQDAVRMAYNMSIRVEATHAESLNPEQCLAIKLTTKKAWPSVIS